MQVVLVEPGAVATPIWDKGVARANDLIDLDADEPDPLYGERLRSFRKLALETGRQGSTIGTMDHRHVSKCRKAPPAGSASCYGCRFAQLPILALIASTSSVVISPTVVTSPL